MTKTLARRFFFVVFQFDADGVLRLKKVMFWAMPVEDLEAAREFWEDTRAKVIADDYEHFIRSSDDGICHVRPKARNSADTTLAPSGKKVKKMAYWLNAGYIKSILSQAEF